MAFKTSSKQKLSTISAISSSVGTGASGPVILSVSITDNSYVNLDDTAVSTSGGYIKLIGTGFVTGCIAYVNGAALTTTFVSSTEIRAVVPALANGTYSLMMFNSAGSGAIWATGLTTSGFPTVTTSSYSNSGNVLNIQLLASGDGTLAYSLQSGSTLPTGVTLSSSGVLSGTASALTSATVVSFTILVNDAQLQTVQQAITLSLTFGDDYFKSTVLAIQSDVTPFISDASTNNLVLTPAGSVKANESNPFQDGYYSGSFNGTSDYLTIPANAALAARTGDFTLELWAYHLDTGAYATYFQQGNVSGGIIFRRNDVNKLQLSHNSVQDVTISTATIPSNQWTHIAVSRSGTTLRTFIDGVVAATVTYAGDFNDMTTHYVGTTQAIAGYYMKGYISNLRIIKGVALYTEAFTPPTQPLTTTEAAVTYVAPATVDYLVVAGGGGGGGTVGGGGGAGGMLAGSAFTVAANTALTVTVGNGGAGGTGTIGVNGGNSVFSSPMPTYSTLFNGSTQYLSVANNSALALTGDFTIECWVYTSTLSGNQGIISSSAQRFGLIRVGIYFYWLGSTDLSASSVAVSANAWQHVAVSRSGSTLKLFVNGIQAGSVASSEASTSNIWYIGSDQSNEVWNGYISNVRIIKGTALYTAAFTVPAGPLTDVAGTSLLTCQNNTIIDNSSNNITITANGNPTTSSTIVPSNTITATGGGGGGVWPYGSGAVGGSGGGGAGSDGTVGNNAAGTVGQGNAGGKGGSVRWGGGGGGAGTIGTDGSATGGHAGAGLPSSISGTTTYYAGGGGGGNDGGIPGNSGLGGGGKGATSNTGAGSNGIANTGGGGGGGGNNGNAGPGYAGGSGVVIIRYADTSSPAVTTGNPDIIVSGGYRIYRFTKSGTIKFRNTSSPAVTAAQTVLLTCQGNRFKDSSTTASAITVAGTPKITQVIPYTQPVNTSGSGYLNGSTDYVLSPSSSQFNLTGDFTIECWIYKDNPAADGNGIFGIGSQDPDSNLVRINGGVLQFWLGGSNSGGPGTGTKTGIISCATSIKNYTWYHIALVRSGSTTNNVKLYLNGVVDGQGTGTYQTGSTSFVIGRDYPTYSAEYFPGYISNLRIVNGTAVYTAAFTPPTAPLTAVTNTSLLTLQTKQAHNNNTYQDTSGYNNALTVAGTPSQGTFSPFSPAGWSFRNSIQGQGLSLSSTAATFGSSADFTVEMWVNLDQAATGNETWFEFVGTSRLIFGRTTTGIRLYNDGVSGNFSYTFANSTWYHIALVRVSNYMRVYINGVLANTPYFNQTNWSGTTITLLRNSDGAEIVTPMYLSNFRVVKGTAVYTADFTPPIAALTAITNTTLLTCQSNRFVDNSINNSALTLIGVPSIQAFSPFKPSAAYDPVLHGGSTYFDGSDSYFTIPASSNFGYGTGDFTWEMWVYPTASNWTSGNFYIVDHDTGNVMQYFSNKFIYSNSTIGTNNTMYTGGPVIPPHSWTHVAITRSSGTSRMFVNGTLITSLADGMNYTTPIIKIGAAGNNTAIYTGYISGLNLIKGFAKYTGSFYVPTAPTPRTSSTTLLLNSTSAAITDASGRNNMRTVGDTKISTSVKKYGAGSMYFDGTGDYITIPSNPNLNFGTGDFTVEAWVNRPAAGTDNFIISASGNGGFGFGFVDGINLGWVRAGVAWDYRPAHGMALNTWNHVALTRSGTSMRLFVNGNQIGTTQTFATAYDLSLTSTTIGSQGANYYFNGYIDDLRITKGVARYVANFTPPTAISVS